ncbi:MAG: RNA methyltransferase [Anaerolineaceae bacterium]|nr:RNA methyltransferase [Anaerolineaceae bacterium]
MISSSANPQIKQIRKLRELKERQKTGLYYIEGIRIVAEAIQQQANLEKLVFAPQLLSSDLGRTLVEEQARYGVPVLEVTAGVFEKFSLKERPQGIAAICKQRWMDLEGVELKDDEIYVALESVQDPGNLGTIMRTNDAVGCKGLILLGHATDPYNPTSIRASMGAVFSQALIKTTLHEFLEWKKKHNIPVVGTSGSAILDYHDFAYPPSMILFMGSERMGLQKQHLRICENMVKIPMVGRSDSLNLGVATAVVLYEIFNQRRHSTSKK